MIRALYPVQVATLEEVFVIDLVAVGSTPGFAAVMANFLPASRPLKLGVGVAEDLRLLARYGKRGL